jgi:PAS domain S-box-containing protein
VTYQPAWFLAGIILIVLSSGFYCYYYERQEHRLIAGQTLSAVADLKSDQIAAWYGERIGDAKVIRDSEMIAHDLRSVLAGPLASGSSEKVMAWMNGLRKRYGYESVRLYDARGVVRLASPPITENLAGQEARELAAALRQSLVRFRDLHRERTNEPVVLDLYVPVPAESGTEQNVGVVGLQVNAERGLFPLVEKWPTDSRSVETILLRREGDSAVILDDTRQRSHLAQSRSFAWAQTNHLAVQVVNGLRGMRESVDDRGVPVLAAVVDVPGTPWIMAAKVDLEEVDAPLHREFWLILGLMCGLIAAAAFAAYALNQAQQSTTPRKEYENEIGRLNRLYAVLSQVNQCIVRARSRGELFAEVCKVTIEFGRFEMAWIGWLDSATRKVAAVAQYGNVAGYLDEIKIYADDRAEGRGPIGTCIREQRTYVCNDFFADPVTMPWRDAATKRNYHALVSVPIRLGGQVAGALSVYAAERDFFGVKEVALLEEAALDISYALDSLEVEQRRQQAEAQLKDREKLLSTIFNQAADAIGLLDLETGRFVEFNTAAHENLGYTREEFAALLLVDLAGEHTPEQVAANIATIRDQGRLTFGTRFRRRDGSLRDVLVRAAGLSIQERDYILAVWSDVTDQHRAVAALRESEERMRVISDNLPESFIYRWCLESDGSSKFLYVSRSVERVLGFTAEAIMAEAGLVSSRMAPEFVAPYAAALEASMRELANFEFEMQSQHRNGQWRWFRSIAHPQRLANGAVVWDGVCTDITVRKQAEEATQRLMVAIDQSVEGIMFTDLEGKVIYINSGYERICGYRRDELVGQKPALLKSGKHSLEFYQNLWQTISRGQVWRGRFTNKRKDGFLFEEEATITPIRSVQGEIISYVATKHDLTRESSLERQLIEAQKMEAIGQLAGGVAHDFNNILAASMLSLGIMLSEPDLSAEMREGLLELKQGTDRAAGLTRQLLMFSRRQAMETRLVELNSLLDGSLKMLRRLLGEHIELSTRLQSNGVWVEADPGMIEQVIMNLCINARDAMPKGGKLAVTIKHEELDAAQPAHPDARPGRFACLTVRDTGCGMPPEIMARIFEPFFTTKEVGKGTGLGLATVHGITKQHNGWVEVSSQPGRGSEFKVYLPAAAPLVVAPVTATGARIPPGNETVLVVEDEEMLRYPLVKLLHGAGYQTFAAADGSEALRLWCQRADELDLLITDMVMPGGMTGLELAEALTALRPALPVILTSGYSQELSSGDRQSKTGFRFLPKPYTPESLGKLIREVLDEAKLGK